MDSNFQVKVSADISALQASLKKVETDLAKFKKSADGAAGATKNMEQNANRGRMVAFAFGQVIRDAGFFANNFSLGILAISNNIPILIDQLSLSIKALQPFAGTLSLIGSLLTAGLTIWAYSSAAVKENKQTVDQYISSLDDLREAQLRGQIDADAELRSLELLRRAAQNETFSKRERLKAVKELQERFPDYYASLSAETIMAGKDAGAHRQLADAIIAVANAKAREELIKENRKTELADNQKLIDLQAEAIKQREIIKESYKKVGSLDAALERLEASNKLRETEEEIYQIAVRRNKARDNAKNLEEQVYGILEKQKSVSAITGDFGEKADGVETYSSVMKSLNDEFERLEFLFTGTFGEKQEGRIKAIQSAIESLRKLGLEKTSKEVSTLAQEISFLEGALKIPNAKSAKVTQTIPTQPSGTGAKITNEDLAKENQKIENARELSRAYDRWALSVQNADEWVQYLAQTVGGELVNSFNSMLTTGTFSFEGIGKAILGMIKKLAAAAMAAAILSSILSSLFPGAGNSGFKDIFGAITGIRLGTGTTAVAPVAGAMTTTGINTSMTTSAAMSATSQPVLETRVSGNDLVILLDRATNNRNKYF